jgi:hypothetical protein
MHHVMNIWGSGGIDPLFLTWTLNGDESSVHSPGKPAIYYWVLLGILQI